jgi:hypothetical protein
MKNKVEKDFLSNILLIAKYDALALEGIRKFFNIESQAWEMLDERQLKIAINYLLESGMIIVDGESPQSEFDWQWHPNYADLTRCAQVETLVADLKRNSEGLWYFAWFVDPKRAGIYIRPRLKVN